MKSRGKAKGGNDKQAKKQSVAAKGGKRNGANRLGWVVVLVVVAVVMLVGLSSMDAAGGGFGSWGDLCWLAGSPGIRTYDEIYEQRSDVHTATYNKTMLWGSYRPQTYFGIRSREEKSFLFSFAWGDLATRQIRYTTEDDSSIVFGWNRHDGTTFGLQQITDLKHRVEMQTSFIKYPNPTDGGSWVARVQGRQLDTSRPLLLSPVFSSQDGYLTVHETDLGYQVKGQTANGKFTATVFGDYEVVSRNVKDEWDFKFSKSGKSSKANQIHLYTEVYGSFDIEVAFESEGDFGNNVIERGCTYTNSLAMRKEQFERRFKEKMGSSEEMPMYAMSNLIGGMGYWHGTGLIDDGTVMEAQELFSAVPSRSKFPRGFLWDEGFHQLVVARWDAQLSQDVILSWLSQMTTSGWIPREQIRGDEPRSRVPSEFVAQNPKFANPPTLLIQIQNFALEQQSSQSRAAFLNLVWPRLTKWYSWFRETQSGNETNTFKWVGKKGYHLLTCGLDDYPRSKCNAEGEKHVDLISWMILMSDTMHTIAEVVGDSKSASDYLDDGLALREALREHHFDDSRNIYADVSGCPPKKDGTPSRKHVSFIGYVTLFPLLTGAIKADAPEVTDIVKIIKSQLLSDYGLRSLSRASLKKWPRHDNYWTGPIWINLNYMLVRALRVYGYADANEEARSLLHQLQPRLIQTISDEYQRTGKLWENYDPDTGHGRGTAPFTGWTSLVVLLMAEN